jgi:hypothetical protein
MAFESEEALANAPNTDAWARAMEDNVGFVSNFDTYTVERVTLVRERAATTAA